MGLYRSSGVYCTQCEAEGFRRITYFLDRPDVLAVYTTRIEATQAEAPRAAGQRQSRRGGRSAGGGRHFAVWHDPLPQALPISSRWSAAISAASAITFTPRSGRKVRARHLCRAGQGGRAPPTRWTRSSARCAGTRRRSAANTISTSSTSSPCPTSTWARWRTRASTSSTTSTCWPTPRDRDRCRLRQHRGDHRARVFPQLDRQPHHLPRLVPALPEGRADRLPRPGILRRQALAAGEAHRRRAHAARARSSPRTPARSRTRCGREVYQRDQQLLHGDGLREGRRGHPHAQDADRRRRVPRGHGPLFRALRRRRRRRSRISSPASPKRRGRDLDAVHALV